MTVFDLYLKLHTAMMERPALARVPVLVHADHRVDELQAIFVEKDRKGRVEGITLSNVAEGEGEKL